MEFNERVSEISKAVENAISFAQSKKEWISKQVINSLLLLIILLVFGCLDFATLKFHFEYLATFSYWSTIGAKVVAGVCAYNIGINIMWETEIKKDMILAEAIKLYNKLISYKQLDFEYFVENIFNPALKRKAYINYINKKIHWLNVFSKAKDRLLYNKVIPVGVENYDELVKELEIEKSKNRYCIKRQRLEDLKSEEYIKKNLDNIKIKYRPVDASVFDLEIDGSTQSVGIKVKGSVAMGKARASANVVFGMLGFSMFFTSTSLDMNQEQFVSQVVAFWHYLLKCVTDIGIVLWQLTRGMLSVRGIISRELTQAYVGRNKVLQDYFEWRLTTNQPNSKIQDSKILADDEFVELTEEEYNKIKNNNNVDTN